MLSKIIPALLAASVAAAVPEPKLVELASSPMNDYNLSYDAAERHLVFARSEADFKKARIFTASRARGKWSKPEPIGFSDPRYSDSDPWLTPDGKTLYFISDRPAPGRAPDRVDYDIWRSERNGSGWSAPEHLGDSVNSKGQELGPELHDGILYFASARKSGKGGLDIYRAEASGRGFATAELLEAPFNTGASESDFTLSRDGSSALFWRTIGGKGVIHFSRRVGTEWSDPKPLERRVNAGDFNFTPAFSPNGKRLRYASTAVREGQASGLADIYEAPLQP